MRRYIGLRVAFIALLLTTPAAAQTKTVINDRASARMLLGNHLFSLQWISWDHFGSAAVTNKRGVYSIKGTQKGRSNTDFMTIKGNIMKIDAKEFTFSGTIVTQVSHLNSGEPCTREGEFTFKITGKRKYWRLMQMDNPCDDVVDYIDIYFR